MHERINLSIIIPTHFRNDDVFKLISTIELQNLDRINLEVIIVSNLPDPKLKSIIQKITSKNHLAFSYFESGKVGVNLARNLGILKSNSSLIYFLDDDTRLDNPLHLESITDFIIKTPGVAALGGGYYLQENSEIIDQVYNFISEKWLRQNRKFESTYRLVGGNTLYNFKILKDNLKFNEDIPFGGSETDLNLKLYQAGFKLIYNETYNVLHITKLTLKELVIKAFNQGITRAFQEEIILKNNLHEKTIEKSIQNSSQLTNIDRFFFDFYFSFYQLFFNSGFRYGRKYQTRVIIWKNFVICLFYTFFQINMDQMYFNDSSNQIKYHEKKLPGLSFIEIRHWLKAHLWWRIPHFILWRLIPFLLILTVYYIIFLKLI